jgi:hypothetical protein
MGLLSLRLVIAPLLVQGFGLITSHQQHSTLLGLERLASVLSIGKQKFAGTFKEIKQ